MGSARARSNKYFRSTDLDYPLVSLSGYLHFWAVAFIVVTAYLAFFQPEVRPALSLSSSPSFLRLAQEKDKS